MIWMCQLKISHDAQGLPKNKQIADCEISIIKLAKHLNIHVNISISSLENDAPVSTF